MHRYPGGPVQTILGLFSDDPEVIGYGVQVMSFMAPFGWVYVFTEVYGCVARGAGSTTIPMVIMIMTVCVFRLLVIFLLLPIWYDIRVIFMCYPISWVMSSICFVVYYHRGKWIRSVR